MAAFNVPPYHVKPLDASGKFVPEWLRYFEQAFSGFLDHDATHTDSYQDREPDEGADPEALSSEAEPNLDGELFEDLSIDSDAGTDGDGGEITIEDSFSEEKPADDMAAELLSPADVSEVFDALGASAVSDEQILEAAEDLRSLLFADDQPPVIFDELKKQILETVFHVGYVLIETTGVNPGTTFGIGTWALTNEGRFPVGYKSGDADFGTGGATGGSKTHTHDVDPASIASGAPSATATVDDDNAGSTVSVGDATHTHDVDVASTTSGDNSDLPPYQVFYFWERTA